MLLLAQGLTAVATAGALEREPPHSCTLGRRLRRGRTHSVDVRAVRGFPPALGEAQQADLKAAVQEPPAESGIENGQLDPSASSGGRWSVSSSRNGMVSA